MASAGSAVSTGFLPERWLPVLGFEGRYEVSDHGRVRALFVAIKGRASLTPPPRLCAGWPDQGYRYVRLTTASGKRAQPRVHMLVLEAFVGARPPGQQSRHLDGVRDHNTLDNLAWGTASENHADMLRHGRAGGRRGLEHHAAKLNPTLVRRIRREHGNGVAVTDMARRYGVYPSAITKVAKRERWAHVS